MANLTRGKFFDAVVRVLRRDLPEGLGDFRTRRFGNILKIYFSVERIHYEVWVDSRRDQIELGLHLEDGPASTIEFLEYLDSHLVEFHHVLGPEPHLGRWTQSWGHFIETHELEPLTRERAKEIGTRMVLYIQVLEPAIRESGITTSGGPKRRRFRKRQ